MWELGAWIATVLYTLASAALFVYGLNWYFYTLSWSRLRRRPLPPPPRLREYPYVTVQIPVYNERHVARRLLEAVARFEWPRDRLEIQVLDDSDDDTTEIVDETIGKLRAEGIDAVHLRRGTREGFKAGALAYGLARAKGELMAIFDCDFRPPKDFLLRVASEFEDPTVGLVQTRWTHLNRDYSRLTRAQALGIDGHFGIEQTVRYRRGYFLNFNGTAGVFRRRCIEDAGGWSGDTLAEDLDLSYRAQLKGWRFVYRGDVVCPAEIPVQIQAFKRQQFRWAKGSIEVFKRSIGPLLRADISASQKFQAVVHLSLYLVHPLMLVSFLLLPVVLLSGMLNPIVPAIFATASLGPGAMYLASQWDEGPRRVRRALATLPYLTLLGVGQSLNNSLAVVQALFGRRSPFLRTPKFGIEGTRGSWRSSRYALRLSPTTFAEWGLAGYGLAAFIVCLPMLSLWFLLWLALYTTSFGLVAILSVYHSRIPNRPLRESASAARTSP